MCKQNIEYCSWVLDSTIDCDNVAHNLNVCKKSENNIVENVHKKATRYKEIHFKDSGYQKRFSHKIKAFKNNFR